MWPILSVMWPFCLSCDQICLSCDQICHVTKSACHVTNSVCHVTILSVMWPFCLSCDQFCLSCDCSVCHVTSSVHHVTNCLPDLQWCNLTCIMCPLQQDLCIMYMCKCFCSTRRSRPYLVWVNNTVYTYMYVSSAWKSGQMWDLGGLKENVGGEVKVQIHVCTVVQVKYCAM